MLKVVNQMKKILVTLIFMSLSSLSFAHPDLPEGQQFLLKIMGAYDCPQSPLASKFMTAQIIEVDAEGDQAQTFNVGDEIILMGIDSEPDTYIATTFLARTSAQGFGSTSKISTKTSQQSTIDGRTVSQTSSSSSAVSSTPDINLTAYIPVMAIEVDV